MFECTYQHRLDFQNFWIKNFWTNKLGFKNHLPVISAKVIFLVFFPITNYFTAISLEDMQFTFTVENLVDKNENSISQKIIL